MAAGTGPAAAAHTTERPAPLPPHAESARGPRGPLTGTGALIRFAVRRDRIRLPAWTAALAIVVASTAGKLEGLYPDATARASVAKTMGGPAALAMTGPRHYLEGGYGTGAMLSHQVIGFYGVLAALMSVLTVVRHTRTEEESGRAELLRSTVVGRHAALTAALAVAAGASLLLGGLLALGLTASGAEGVTWEGSLLFGAAFAGLGAVFAGVAAVTVQITEHARAASGAALGAIGVAYVLRAAGDVGDGTLSWLSPIGWAQRCYPFVDDLWWPLLPTAVTAAVACAAGYTLSVRRDVGRGLREPRPGRRNASAALARPFGFALRLHRGTVAGFGTGLFLLGAMYGALLGDVDDMLGGVRAVKDVLAGTGGTSLAESFASVVMIVNAVVAAAYMVLAGLRPRAEESAGRAEPLLATGLSRTGWLWSHVSVTLMGGTFTLLLAGLGSGLAGAASTGDGELVLSLTGAALAYAPALWVTAGVVTVLHGWAPKVAGAAWLVPAYAFLVGYLGRVLRFPGWMNDLSPFGHVPQLPAQEMEWTPAAVLTALAAVLIAAGLAGFRRRDLETK